MSETTSGEQSSSDVSMLLAVYAGDEPADVDTALESVFWQTHQPTEVVLVQDGPMGRS